MAKAKWSFIFQQLWDFFVKQLKAVLFGALILLGLGLSKYLTLPWLERYDWLLIYVLLIQVILLWTKFERAFDLIAIMIFHIMGMVLEIYKVKFGSWTYPEPALFEIFNVPLYSAFMYSAIGSYIVRIIKEMDIEVKHWPRWYYLLGLSGAIYLNFFTDTHGFDYRDFLYIVILILFWKTKFTFKVGGVVHEWLAVIGFFLIGLFIYFAENIGSFFNAWRYSYQLTTWRLVDVGKISSWTLLIIITIIIVVELQRLANLPLFAKKLKIKNIIKE
ncbi:DUF817 family protein [Lactococcus kimchii]|uniref:DUF817 family protein n=1 Tax=Lactococcus sp. S-13 TaxID=2507158 RepID=UPI001023437F|nr:DUF817 family protein [Lactococcus sp. S-13]RZI49168.1 DUF817 family protein [Lactococcus sp. S-13]